MKTTKLLKVKRHVMLPEWLLRKVEKEAAAQGFDFSAHLTRLCERWIDAGCPKGFAVFSLHQTPETVTGGMPVSPERIQREAPCATAGAVKV